MSMGSGGVFGPAARFNPLALLLGQQAAMPAADEFRDPTTGENTIVVDGSNRQPPVGTPPIYGEAPERPTIDPRYVLNDDRIAPSEEDIREIVPRKGMFGVKGTLRDVLGMLGDAFLVQGGGEAVYQPRRDEERKADAVFGLSGDPMQAAERLAAAGFAEEAAALYEKAATVDYRNRSLESQEATRRSQITDRQYDNVLKARNQVARWMEVANTPGKVAVLMREAQRLADELGVPLSQLGIDDENLTEDERAVGAGGDMTVTQHRQLPLAQERVAIQGDTYEAKKDGGMFDRPPPRPGPQPRSQTSLELWRDIDRRIERGGKVTAGERAFHKKWSTGGGKSSRLNGIVPPPSGGNARRFRRLN